MKPNSDLYTTISLEKIADHTIGVRKNTHDPSKKTVILIHGIGVSSLYLVPLAQHLSARYNVHALDLPGYGITRKPAKPLTIHELAVVTLQYLEEHAIQKPTLIGHSMGSQIIAELNKNKPKYLDKMILLAPTANRKERSVLLHGLRLLQDTFYETLKVNMIIFSDYIRMGAVRFLRTARWMVEHRIEDTLRETHTPTLIIRGGKDHIVPKEWVQYLSSLSQYITAEQIPKVPHAFQYNNAQETARLCQNFIEK